MSVQSLNEMFAIVGIIDIPNLEKDRPTDLGISCVAVSCNGAEM